MRMNYAVLKVVSCYFLTLCLNAERSETLERIGPVSHNDCYLRTDGLEVLMDFCYKL